MSRSVYVSIKRMRDAPENHVYNTPPVITTAKASTLCTVHLSTFHDVSDFCERCLYGSPKVSASPPHPQTHEQYQRFPYKYTITGTAMKISAIPHPIINIPSVPSRIISSRR